MSITAVTRFLPSLPVPSFRGVGGMFSVARKLLPVALSAIALANLPGASAGPITYAACMAGVTASGPAAPALWQTCLIFLGPWCP